ncbi:serine/threonine-protein kinase [Streptomyces sp. NRRL F-5135]|uniref:serine/threonine-protein kinase n=1 Tax=Streptomyces sp. NRRL F-5135 TaxID=1463858 RepID=UPI0004C65FD4|nr:serine/threonine-protein kinase [Streptomyces sp. NRRL F-5135]
MDPLDAVDDPPVLGPFELLAVLGKGGMGKVYLARRLPLEGLTPEMEVAYFLTERGEARESGLAAVKVIRPDFLSRDDTMGEDQKRARFAREISAVQAVVGDRVPSLLGADPRAARPWFAVDYIPGPDLSTMVQGCGTFSVGPFAALGLALVDALRSIHGAGLLHRDLKPLNVVLGPSGPVVLDFGLVVAAERGSHEALTKTGIGFGTANYMPYEQALDFKRVKEPGDVYSLGATLFFASAGRPPFSRGPMMGSPSWAGVDAEFRPLLARIITHHERQRPSLDDVQRGLEELLVANGLTEEQAEGQLRAAVAASGLTPALPPEAAEDHANAEVRQRAQAAVNAGAAPDSPWRARADHASADDGTGDEDDDLFEELLGAGTPPPDPSPLPAAPPPPAPSPPAPSPPAPPAAAAAPPRPPAVGAAEPQEVPGGTPPTPAAPTAALKAAEALRRAYARRDRM